MLSTKTKFLLIVKVIYFSDPFGITPIFYIKPISCIIILLSYPFKLWNVTGTFLVNLRLTLQLLWAEPQYLHDPDLFFIISCSKQFITYPAIITWLKSSFIFCRHKRFLLKCLLILLFAIFHFFQNCFNKFINYIFSSVRNNWFANFIIKNRKEYELDIFQYMKYYYFYHYF